MPFLPQARASNGPLRAIGCASGAVGSRMKATAWQRCLIVLMALLGIMSLAGMLIKNSIVLIDQIDLEMASSKEPFQAVVDSGVSRLIPVSMAALTTILGMTPLLQDAFFISMAVTIMFGLGFATVLTLIVVPVLYAIFYRVPYKADAL